MITLRNLEVMKWCGVLCMLIDHFALYVLHQPNAYTEFAGALALPLFACALGWGLGERPIERGWAVALRVAYAALFAQLMYAFVGTVAQLTVLATLALGVMVYLVCASPRRWLRRVLELAGLALLASYVEFGWFGVSFVSACCWFGRERSQRAAVAAALLLATLTPYNASFGAIAALPLVAIIATLKQDLPRVRHVFYAIYCGQFPILWALSRAFSAYG